MKDDPDNAVEIKPMELNNHQRSSSSSLDTRRILSSSRHDYEVFLSFRGPDTRAGFTDFLYHSLRDAGVNVFRDDEELRVGEKICSNLTEAVNNSKISIPILSKGYASSKWCLEELVHIVESRKAGNQIVIPIFYNVSPSDVRNQTGSFGDSLRLHECRFSDETLRKWKGTLKEVGTLKGWDLTTRTRPYEAEVIKEVVNMVLRQLKKSYMVVTDFVVGVENHVEKIKSMISVDSKGVKMIRIHGMGGIGKTTLAKIIYNQLSHDYEGCSFLANVREISQLKDTGLMCLQKQLISEILKSEAFKLHTVDEGIRTIKEKLCKKKVLVCLDDVSKRNQLNALVGDSSWFGPGSRIIVTTRNKEILNEVGADSSYEVTEMDFNRSLQLFSKHAFRRDCPPLNYITFSEKVVRLTGGLPLALEVIGSLLHGKPKDSWRARLTKLEKVPHEEVGNNLKISYEELDIRQKQIFLDVACFFVGFDKRVVLHFWDSNLYPEEGMEVLEHMSLLKIRENNDIWMHDQLIDFGKSITYEKGNIKQENRRRMCENDEAFGILRKAQKEEIVEAMFVALEDLYEFGFTEMLFSSLPKLTFLQVDASPYLNYYNAIGKKLRSGWRTWTNPTVLPQLRWLSWHGFDPRFLRIKLSACNLVILDLSDSEVTHKWEGWSQMKAATNLKVLNLSSCRCLIRTPNLSAHMKLERLILRHCEKLIQIDKSIGQLKRLVFLDLSSCQSFRNLPEEMSRLDALMELVIDGSGVRVLPDLVGNLKSLKVLSLNGTVITELPAAIGRAENLEEIYLERCDSFRDIPSEIGRLSSLIVLKITNSSCCGVHQVPNLPESVIFLHLHFYKYGWGYNQVPDLSNLVNLRELDLRLYHHKEAPSLLWWIEKLSKLETLALIAHGIPRISIGNDLGSLSNLKRLHLINCRQLQTLPRLPSSLLDLCIKNCHAMETTIDISNLSLLLKLEVLNSAETRICGLPPSLVELHIKGCNSKTFGDISNLKMLSQLRVVACTVTEIWGLNCLENLKRLHLLGLSKLERLPDLGSLSQLKEIVLFDCSQLLGFPKLPPNLVKLIAQRCPILLLDVSNSTMLEYLSIVECQIEEIRGLHSLVNLSCCHFEGHSFWDPKPQFLERKFRGKPFYLTVTD